MQKCGWLTTQYISSAITYFSKKIFVVFCFYVKNKIQILAFLISWFHLLGLSLMFYSMKAKMIPTYNTYRIFDVVDLN